MSPATSPSPMQTLDMEQPPSAHDGSGIDEAPWHRGLRRTQPTWPHAAKVSSHGAGPSLMLMVLESKFPSPRGTREAGDFQLWHQSIQNPRMHLEQPPDTQIACMDRGRGAQTGARTSLHSYVGAHACVCVHRGQCGHTGHPQIHCQACPCQLRVLVLPGKTSRVGSRQREGQVGWEGGVWGQQEGVTLKLVAGET